MVRVLPHLKDGPDGSHCVALPDHEPPDVHLELVLCLCCEAPAIRGEQDVVDLFGEALQQVTGGVAGDASQLFALFLLECEPLPVRFLDSVTRHE